MPVYSSQPRRQQYTQDQIRSSKGNPYFWSVNIFTDLTLAQPMQYQMGTFLQRIFSGPIPTSNAQVVTGVRGNHPRRSRRGLFSDLKVIELSSFCFVVVYFL